MSKVSPGPPAMDADRSDDVSHDSSDVGEEFLGRTRSAVKQSKAMTKKTEAVSRKS